MIGQVALLTAAMTKKEEQIGSICPKKEWVEKIKKRAIAATNSHKEIIIEPIRGPLPRPPRFFFRVPMPPSNTPRGKVDQVGKNRATATTKEEDF